MAHTCPVCGATCHCNGDIDDLCLDFPEDVEACIHCDDEYDYEEEFGCLEDEFDCDTVEGGCGCCPFDTPICASQFEEDSYTSLIECSTKEVIK